jgi:hypothetical protein
MPSESNRRGDFPNPLVVERLQAADNRTISANDLSFLIGWLVFGVGRAQAVGILREYRNAHALILAHLSQPEMTELRPDIATLVAEARA